LFISFKNLFKILKFFYFKLLLFLLLYWYVDVMNLLVQNIV
jgi:hypothetical protein